MATGPGMQIGAYTLVEKVGEGGMGEVYRATDAKLKRDVAIKLLPEAFTADPERLARFQREAQLLAQLLHPNIAAIFGIEESDGVRALVMELVHGPTLAERMAPGPLPLDEALAIALQIAEALEAAHAKGIVHRDLKPANVKLTPDGQVKVLDFGLAKALDPTAEAAGPASVANSPTLTSAGSRLGMILGTASYMSPEQARGVATDKRADIWAFGVVLYEMLVGGRLFDGEMVSDILAGVLKNEIDLGKLPGDTPASIRRLLRRCLERKPKNRLHDIADARIVIQEVLAGETDEAPAAAAGVPAPPARSTLLPWLIAAVAVAALVGKLLLGSTTVPPERPGWGAYPLAITPPPAGGQYLIGSNSGWGTISPDGRQFVVRAATAEGTGLWVRSLDRDDGRLLPETADGFYPFWSPDSRHVGFFSRGNLQRIEVAGGLPEVVCVAQWGRGGSWSESGRIVFSPAGGGAIHVVDADGGTSRAVTRIATEAREDAHYWPVWLPDGEHFLYFIRSGRREDQGIYFARVPADGLADERRRVVASSSAGVFVPAADPGEDPMLLWVQDEVLLARAFDPTEGAVYGPTSRIAQGVRVLESQRASMISVSNDGTLLWASTAFGRNRLAWFDRQGRGPDIVPTAAKSMFQPVASPDGRWVAFVVVENGQGDPWILDTRTGDTRPLLSTPTYEENIVWSPDSKEILMARGGVDDSAILRMRIDGSDSPRELTFDVAPGERADQPLAWLPGGWMIAKRVAAEGTGDLLAYPLEGPGEPIDFLVAPGDQEDAVVSPNAKAVAYVSDESGSLEGYIASVSMAGGRPALGPDRRRIPVDDAVGAGWNGAGDELFVLTSTGGIFSIPVEYFDGVVRPGKATRLFDIPSARTTTEFGVAAAGDRFLMIVDPAAEYQTLSLLLDWRSRLEPSR